MDERVCAESATSHSQVLMNFCESVLTLFTFILNVNMFYKIFDLRNSLM
jgi:hypothetical protein